MDQQQSDDTQAWKVFNRDTQAGRLLSRLYGEKPTSKVSYPQQNRRRRRRPTNNSSAKEDNENAKTWKTTGCVTSWNKTAEEEKENDEDDEERDNADGNNSLDMMECDNEDDESGRDDTAHDMEEEEDTNQVSDDEDEDFGHFNASFGFARYFKMNDGTKKPVSYAALYRHRGKELKHMSRYVYSACVDVVETSSAESNDIRSGRKKRRAFPFGEGLGFENNYHQVLRVSSVSRSLPKKFQLLQRIGLCLQI